MSTVQLNKLVIIFLALFLIIGCQFNKETEENNQKLKEFNNPNSQKIMKKITDEKITYVALGDSYTKGEGILSEDNYPNQLVQQLQVQAVDITLASNPSETGWTTQQVIKHELKEVVTHQPNLVTLLIGVNDWVQGRSPEEFQQDFSSILEEVLKTVDSNRIIVITIPDFSTSPRGNVFSGGRDISQGIAEFNEIIKKESEQRNIVIVDIYPLSQEQVDARYYAADGIHYSAIAYGQWVELILPTLKNAIETNQ